MQRPSYDFYVCIDIDYRRDLATVSLSCPVMVYAVMGTEIFRSRNISDFGFQVPMLAAATCRNGKSEECKRSLLCVAQTNRNEASAKTIHCMAHEPMILERKACQMYVNMFAHNIYI